MEKSLFLNISIYKQHHAEHFIQRMKFYALHKFNSIVKKGKFDYSTLAKIYCVGILANNINPYEDYQNIINLRNEKGELIDDQMTFVTVELDKFTLQEVDCQTDLYDENDTYTYIYQSNTIP